jgi:hypothetical protein
MTLESRAARATRSLRGSVASVAPVPVGVVARRHRVSLVSGLAATASLAVAGVALASALSGLDDGVDEAAATVPTTMAPPVTSEPGDAPEPTTPVAAIDHEQTGVVYQLLKTSAEARPHTKFFGSAPPGTIVAASSAFGSASTVVDHTGTFVLAVTFTDPPPGVEFPVTVRVGDETRVFPFTWTWDPSAVAVTAEQTFGSSSVPPPYEIFYGTAAPGAIVTASSPYGSGQATAGAKGEWVLKLFFSGAPSGQPFTVNVRVGSQSFSFPFTWTQSTTTTTKPQQQAPASFTVLEVHKDEGQGQWMKILVGGPVGTVVQLTSDHGSSATVTIDDSGKGSVKVFFSGAPKDVSIPVSLKVNGSTHSTYGFTNQWDPADTPITIDVWTEWKVGSAKVKAYGTAPPGTSVSVSTNGYGSANGSAGSDGKYTLLLQLSPVPDPGATVEVTVTVGGEIRNYVFTYDPS